MKPSQRPGGPRPLDVAELHRRRRSRGHDSPPCSRFSPVSTIITAVTAFVRFESSGFPSTLVDAFVEFDNRNSLRITIIGSEENFLANLEQEFSFKKSKSITHESYGKLTKDFIATNLRF